LTTLSALAVGWVLGAEKVADAVRKGFLIRPIDHGADIVGKRSDLLQGLGTMLT